MRCVFLIGSCRRTFFNDDVPSSRKKLYSNRANTGTAKYRRPTTTDTYTKLYDTYKKLYDIHTKLYRHK